MEIRGDVRLWPFLGALLCLCKKQLVCRPVLVGPGMLLSLVARGLVQICEKAYRFLRAECQVLA